MGQFTIIKNQHTPLTYNAGVVGNIF